MDPGYYANLNPQNPANEGLGSPSEQLQQSATAYADLSYKHQARGHSLNNPPPDTWTYPHKKGIGTGSNLDSFKEEIAARTERGENCKAIADALNAMGVQTSDRAVSRARIKWGMRKRAQRRVKTPPPGSDAARLSAKSKVQALRKSELIRMTREGMTADEIYRNLTSRGMELKKGVATVLRLQSAWGLAHNEKRWLGNFRHQCHKKAKAQQLEAFNEIAEELEVQDMDAWMQEKMGEEAARQARHELALKLMGENAPTNPERRKLQSPRGANVLYVKQMLEPIPDDEESSPEAGDDGDVPMDRTSHHTDTGAGIDDGHDAMYDQEDEEDYDAEGDSDDAEGLTHTLTLGIGHVGNTMSQPTTASLSVQWPGPEGNSTAAANAGGRSTRSGMQTALTTVQQIADPSTSISRAARQSAAKPAPIPAFEAPTLCRPTNVSTGPQAHTQPSTSHTLAASPATASSIPSTGRFATTAATVGRSEPTLVLRAEEAKANKSTLSALDQYDAAAKGYKVLLEARNENKPLPGSLTGLPPSAKEVDAAKRKLKELTQAMMLSLD